MIEQFKKLAEELYAEGYQCGISGENSDRWFMAWALAMQKVADGIEYDSNLVISCFNELYSQ